MTVLIAILLGATWFDWEPPATPKPAPVPAVKPSPEAVPSKPVVTLVVTPNCGYCDIQAARLKELGIKYQVRIETAANNKYAGYPVLELPGRTLHGLQPKETIQKWVDGK